MSKGLTAVAVVVPLLLAGCVTSDVPHTSASPAVAKAVKSGAVVAGSARIVAFKGSLLSYNISWKPTDPATGDLLVNGADVGGVNKNQAIFIDVPPGAYNVAWKDVGDSQKISPLLSLELAAGQVAYLSMDRQMKDQSGHGGEAAATGVLGGAVGGAIVGLATAAAKASDEKYHGPLINLQPDGLALIQDMQIVIQDNSR